MKKQALAQNTKRPLVLLAVILAMFMAAVEATIVATAMPSIVADLGGFSIFSWVFGSYLLMQVVSIPIYGKLADIYGRKIVFSCGIIFFLIGSLICGLSKTMGVLIAGRFIQGLGAGAVQPIAQTIVGDIYPKEERAQIQGYLASVWGISSILGPILGGIFVEYLHWSWVFLMNIPFGVVSLIFVNLFLKESIEKKEHAIDYFGSLLMFIGTAALMLVLIQAGTYWAWNSKEVIFFSSMFLITFILFIFQEKRAKEPMINVMLWKNRLILFANIVSFAAGGMLLSVSSFLPTYVQGVMNASALVAGLTVSVISLGWPLASTIAGKIMFKQGYRKIALLGGVSLVFGSLFYVSLPLINNAWWAGFGSFFVGVGMGLSLTTFIVAIQSSVDWTMRGEATASNMFMRILGGSVVVALLGGILNSRLSGYLTKYKDELSFEPTMDVINLLIEQNDFALAISEKEMEIIQNGLIHSLSAVYWGILFFAIISFVFILLLPKDKKAEN